MAILLASAVLVLVPHTPPTKIELWKDGDDYKVLKAAVVVLETEDYAYAKQVYNRTVASILT